MSQKGATERARRMSHLVIGPWGHGPTQKFGALDFGPTANVDALPLQLRWYDHWLKGIDNGLASEAPVKLFVMGRNEWVYERDIRSPAPTTGPCTSAAEARRTPPPETAV